MNSISKAATAMINLPLPYSVRRTIFKNIRPKDYAYFQWLKNNVEKGSEHSLVGYLENQCIFVHIPKCAGISVCQSLFSNHGGSHMGIRQYQLAFTKKEFTSFFKFTFVRNPWDRLYSAYKFLARGGRSVADRSWFQSNLAGFKDFETFVLEWVNPKNIWSYPHFVPQHYFLEDCSDRINLDFIGHFETIQTDFIHVCKVLGIEAQLQHRNFRTNQMASNKTAYNSDLIAIVHSVYQRDIELFGYQIHDVE